MYDIDLIKGQLNSDSIISIMDSFDCPVVKANQNELIFPSICHHHDDFMEHKPKLYYYISTQRFKCYSCGETWDIFGLIQHIADVDFKQSIEMVCRLANINIASIGNIAIDNWRSMKKFLPNEDYQEDEPIKIFDNGILNCFEKLYPQSWLDEGITKETMDKFNIGWYAPRQAITIPVLDFSGNLVGIRARFTKDYDIQRGKYRPLSTLNDIYKFPTGRILYGAYQSKDEFLKSGMAYIVEGEKSVLKAATWGVNNVVACFGHNISHHQIMQLISLGVTDVCLCFDSDYHSVGDDEWNIFKVIIKNTITKLKPYFSDISVCYNNQGYDGYKFSPFDFTMEQFKKIFENRVKIY